MILNEIEFIYRVKNVYSWLKFFNYVKMCYIFELDM